MIDSAPTRETLMTIDEVMDEYQMGRSSVWLFLKQTGIERFKIPGRGRNTYVRRSDIERARNSGIRRRTTTDMTAEITPETT
ncbi:MAG: hypothetical protein M3464_06085 [Chloroflexota bacterium]|nr:hypothetical protein [Chloroflexota bacterium]